MKVIGYHEGITQGSMQLGIARAKRWRKEMFYLTTHSTHIIYGYMASDIW